MLTPEQIVKVLDEHTRGSGGCCACGWQHVGQSAGGVGHCRTQHTTHVAEQIAALLPETVEWGVRYARHPSVVFPVSESIAHELADENPDASAVCRTAWHTEWTEVTQ